MTVGFIKGRLEMDCIEKSNLHCAPKISQDLLHPLDELIPLQAIHSSPEKIKLVKDLSETRVILYWIDDSGSKISPKLPSLTHAEEWKKEYLFSRYLSHCRRESIIDRRRDGGQRSLLDEALFKIVRTSSGRRVTDVSVQVDIDLAARKLLELCIYL